MTPETRLKNKVNKYLGSLGSEFWGFKVVGNGWQKSGVPDIIGCLNGRFVGIENKAPDGELSKKQEREVGLIIKAGGAVCVPRSLEEVVEFMEALR